jgi:tetratricopeptide (TPR) repeat protein
MPERTNFFVVGGTLGGNASSYIQRPLDDELLRLTLAGEYCNVLAARQMGKSSLMVRTAQKLRNQGVRSIIIDITAIGSSVSASEWYFGLLSRLARELKLDIDEQAWWKSGGEKSPVQRFSDFLRDVILEQVHEPIVVFIDEIDSTLKLDFTDDFFAAIRAIYNARSRDEVYKRLTFVLLGVARPGDLIKDRTRTPYNIGVNVDVTDFRLGELDSFRQVLEQHYPGLGGDILQWVLDWTGGQPYLTQKICAEIAQANGKSISNNDVDSLVEAIFISDQARTETNLRAIRDRIQNSPYLMEMLGVYRRVLAGKKVMAEERSIAQNELKLTGLLSVSPQGILQVRNQIYAHIFDANWIKNSAPASVNNRRLIAAISSVAVVAIALAGFFYYRQINQAIDIQAQTYVENFNNSSSQEVRISNLAGLFGLGGEYKEQALALFQSLSYEDQLALFDLAAPDNVGNELVIVVNGVYQSMQDTTEGNTLLTAMADTLEGTNASGAVSLVIEINAWVNGREAAALGQYEVAVDSFETAWERSESRGNPNLDALLERALAFITLEQYDNALKDLDTIIELDATRAGEVNGIILGEGNEALADYLREHPGEYRNVENALSVPAPTPTVEVILTSTPLPSEIFIGGIEMVLVPAGEFVMGDNISVNSPLLHTIYLEDYYIDKYEVTNKAYSACEQAGECKPPHDGDPNYDNPLYANHPIVFVDWYQAKTYCEWRDGRLPTEAEWEKAARGTDGRLHPWNTGGLGCSFANYRLVDSDNFFGPACVGHTVRVGYYEKGKSPYGLYDMAGNVGEWVNSLFDFPYPYDETDGREDPEAKGLRGVRGGSWNGLKIRSSERWGTEPSEFYFDTGFRCAMDAP